MKFFNVLPKVGVLALGLIASASPSQADVSVRFGYNTHRPHRHVRAQRHYHRPVYYAPFRAHRHSYVTVTPLVVPAPVYVQPPITNPSLSSNYGQDLAEFRERLQRLRLVVEKQKEKSILPQPSYDRFMSTLDGIERDLQARLYERGGTLRSDDFADFFRRLDVANEDVQVALAQ